jgi:uncharacterized membrane protein (DUF485 family)
MMHVTTPTPEERRRRIRRSVVWLTLLALSFYVGFIALAIMRDS